MRSLPRFLILAVFLAALIGCQTIPTPAPKTVNPHPGGSTRTPTVAPSQIGSFYNDVQNGPLARYLRGETETEVAVTPDAIASVGERRQVEFICAPVGKFNLAPDGEVLYFKMRCTERNPNDTVISQAAEDVRVYREPGKHAFRIRFRDAAVSVQDLGNGRREVRLHYRDTEGTFHDVELPEQKGREHAYSFASLVPDTLEPIVELRTMEIGGD